MRMLRGLLVVFLIAHAAVARAAEWHAEVINTPARVTAIDTVDGKPRVLAGGLWYDIDMRGGKPRLVFLDEMRRPQLPADALPGGSVATGTRDIARAWLAAPTTRYKHTVLGDDIEAGSIVIETAAGVRHTVTLGDDAVFEDLAPRLADLDGDGRDEIVVVKSYLKRGAALAVIAQRNGRYGIVAETPPLGAPNRWLNPAGIADFTGDGKIDIALVRQPHVVGSLELWTYDNGRLRQAANLGGFSNHVAGSSALNLSAVADIDGDGTPDLALPALDLGRLRIVSFKPAAREIASIPLPSTVAGNIGVIAREHAPPAFAVALADGTLVVVRND
ncbi:FG-GAP repeat domain-containing protein [Undibacter mobilis]|uniref:VCBS repeat-containing protein n=1 Tax=Undibacter mobilis TaxID=2292256 RepID=A0A371BD51_9BRAD|nr:VCBS repeat-containing protein [Undibacter mobilis]RDV05323.1 VCBS repeat-containing protein [Undibacter mobilis]